MKKFISCMLALVMVLGIMSVGVMAADPVVNDNFNGYADTTAAKVNWSTAHGLVDDGNDGQALQVNVSGTATTGNTYYKPTVAENVYAVSFRVKAETDNAATKVAFLTNNVARFEADVTTEWTTVSGVAFVRGNWTSNSLKPKFMFYGPGDGTAIKYYIDDVVFTPYSGNILEGLNADFETYSTTELVGFTGQPSSSTAFKVTPTNAGDFGYDTGADGTGYSLKIVGSGAVRGIKFTSGAQMPAQQLRLNFKLKSTVANADVVKFYVGGAEEYAQVTETGVWESKEVLITPVTLSNAGTAMYIQSTGEVDSDGAIWVDDVCMTVVANEVAAPEPEVYNVAITGDAGANVSVEEATSTGDAVNYTVTPKFGYYIASITVDGTPYTGFNAYTGGTYSTGTISKDTAIVVTTASFAANDKGVSTDVATLPVAFAEAGTAVTFGKVLDAEATSYGVELTQNGQPVLTYHGGGPLYKANAKNASGQYAVEFVGLEAGTYTVRTYVIVNGAKTFGAPATFTVAAE